MQYQKKTFYNELSRRLTRERALRQSGGEKAKRTKREENSGSFILETKRYKYENVKCCREVGARLGERCACSRIHGDSQGLNRTVLLKTNQAAEFILFHSHHGNTEYSLTGVLCKVKVATVRGGSTGRVRGQRDQVGSSRCALHPPYYRMKLKGKMHMKKRENWRTSLKKYQHVIMVDLSYKDKEVSIHFYHLKTEGM